MWIAECQAVGINLICEYEDYIIYQADISSWTSQHVGPSFLEGNRTIIACIVPKNLFVDDYKLNFPPNVSYEQDAGRG